MRSQWPQSENANQLLKGQYICFLQRLTSFTTCLENKNTVYIDNHKTTRLAGQFNSLYISVFSQEVLNKIKKPSSEWRWPRHIRDKFQKVENMSKTKKSTSYSSFTKFTYNWIYKHIKVFWNVPWWKGFHAFVHKATKNIDWPSFFIRVSVGFY